MRQTFIAVLMAFFLFGCETANAEMQCGFGCFLKENKKTIDSAISYSAEIARDIPLPPTQLYGWGVYTLMNGDEIYNRSKSNQVSLWASSKAQVVKEGVPFLVDLAAPAWGRGVLNELKKTAVTGLRDYAWGELFEGGYGAIYGEEPPPADKAAGNMWRLASLKASIPSYQAQFLSDPMFAKERECHPLGTSINEVTASFEKQNAEFMSDCRHSKNIIDENNSVIYDSCTGPMKNENRIKLSDNTISSAVMVTGSGNFRLITDFVYERCPQSN